MKKNHISAVFIFEFYRISAKLSSGAASKNILKKANRKADFREVRKLDERADRGRVEIRQKRAERIHSKTVYFSHSNISQPKKKGRLLSLRLFPCYKEKCYSIYSSSICKLSLKSALTALHSLPYSNNDPVGSTASLDTFTYI